MRLLPAQTFRSCLIFPFLYLLEKVTGTEVRENFEITLEEVYQNVVQGDQVVPPTLRCEVHGVLATKGNVTSEI